LLSTERAYREMDHRETNAKVCRAIPAIPNNRVREVPRRRICRAVKISRRYSITYFNSL